MASGRAPRRANAATDQTMRVSVGHLDNLNNLMGELVVNRNSLEQDQEQLRQLELDLEAKIIDPDTFEEAADAVRKGFEDALRTAEQIRDLNEQYAERAAEIDAERIQALSQVSQQPLQIEDVRTGAGISEFLRLATGRPVSAANVAAPMNFRALLVSTAVTRAPSCTSWLVSAAAL
jgi:hypothetical protein